MNRSTSRIPLLILLAWPILAAAQPAISWQHMDSPMTGSGTHIDVRGEDELYVVQRDSYSYRKLVRLDRATGDTVWTVTLDTLELNFGAKVIGTDGVMVGGANGVLYELARFDTSGALIWHQRVALSAPSYGLGGFVCDAEENTYITYFEGPNDWHTHVAKYSVVGELQWDYEYLPSAFQDNTPRVIRLDQQGNVLVGGEREFDGQPYDSKAFVLALDPNGDELWVRNYVNNSNRSNVTDIWAQPDGRILVAINDGAPYLTARGSVVAYSSAGTQLWAYDAPNGLEPELIVENDWNGSYYVIARYADDDDMQLLEFSQAGSLLDQTLLPFEGDLRDAIAVAEGRILLSSVVLEQIWDNAHFTLIDTEGAIVWDLAYVHNCTYCYTFPNPWPLIATDPSHVYTAGSRYNVSYPRPVALEISIPCVPEVGYCLGQQYADTLSISTQAWAADVTGDGYTDMLTTFSFDEEVHVHANTGGHFELQQTVPLAHMGGPIRSSDLNGDGLNDVIVAEDLGEQVTVLLNNSGTLVSAGGVSTGFAIGQVELGQADGASGPDLFVRYFAGPMNEVHVFMNNGSGVFTGPVVVALPVAAEHMSVGDVDQDGLDDLAVIGEGDGLLYHALGGGSYGAVSDIPFNGSVVEIRDVNDDGWRDIVTSGNNMATVGINQGGDVFEDEEWNLPGIAYRGVPHPFPGDSTVRFFLSDPGDEVVGLDVWSDCVNEFSMFELSSSAQSTLFATDVTGDGINDLLAFRMDHGRVLIWPNCGQGPPLGLVGNAASSSDQEMLVFPNPADDQATVRCPEGSRLVSIMDAQGRVLLRRVVPSTLFFNVQLEAWAPGTYLVVCSGIGGTYRASLLLAH